jgi:outer membrane PBP1 activator LpoA protein
VFIAVPESRADRPSKLVSTAARRMLVAALLVLAGCVSEPPAPPPEPAAQAPIDPEQAARDAEARGDFGAAARAWQTLAAERPSPGREAYQLRAASAWLAAGDASSSQALLSQIDARQLDPTQAAERQLLLARLALGRGDQTQAAGALAPIRGVELPPALASERDTLAQQLPAVRATAPARPVTGADFVAVLLPYGGGLDSAARAIGDGVLAARLADRGGPDLRFYTTGADAGAVYRQAIGDGAAAVIGPLQKPEVAALAAAPLPRPTLALNNPEPAIGQVNLYRLSLDPADEANAGAAWLTAAGYRDVALLFVDDAWGRRQRDLYAAAMQAQGGHVTVAAPFDAGDTDFSATLRRLFAARLSAGEAPAPTTAAPPGPQALIVVASATDARQIVPQLGYVGVFGLPVLTTSQVWNGQPAPPGDTDLDNVVFCDSPWVLGGGQAGPAAALTAARGAWPALGQDAPRLVALGADAYAVAARLRLGDTVDALPDGLTGALALDADGTLRRQVLTCARFAGGSPVPLTPSGAP